MIFYCKRVHFVNTNNCLNQDIVSTKYYYLSSVKQQSILSFKNELFSVALLQFVLASTVDKELNLLH